jgi:hypothetical protein
MESALGGRKTPQERIEDVIDGPFFKRCILPWVTGLSGDGPCYLVWGHTHHPEVLPIWKRSPMTMLFNTGTFRPRVLACGAPGQACYLIQDTLSFAVFYRDDEKGRTGQAGGDGFRSYEHWHGLQMTR